MPSFSNYEDFKRFRDETVPGLILAGWVEDDDGPKIPNPIGHGLPPLRLRYRSPEGLYYGLRDAIRVVCGQTPRRRGIPKLSERQRRAVLRYLHDPENASSVVESCPEFPSDEGSSPGYEYAVEMFIDKLRREAVGI